MAGGDYREHCEATQSKAMTHLFTFSGVVYINVCCLFVFFIFFFNGLQNDDCILRSFEQDVATLSQHVSRDKFTSYHTLFN